MPKLKQEDSLKDYLHFLHSNITKQELDFGDVNNIAYLLVDPRYKSLEKLWNNIIIDLMNRAFRDCEKIEEFLAIKWTVSALKLVQGEIKNKYNKAKAQQYAKSTESDHASLEDVQEDLKTAIQSGESGESAQVIE